MSPAGRAGARRRPPAAAALAAAVAALAAGSCAFLPEPLDPGVEVGLPVMSLRWKFQAGDRGRESKPQEFASPVIATGPGGLETIFVGSQEGTFFALAADRGRVLWKRPLGSVSSRATVDRGRIYVGTDDGLLLCLGAADGEEKWQYLTRGAVLQPPVVSGDVVVFSNEADQVYALDRQTGKFRWQYRTETPEAFTLRGHAGVAIDGDLIFTGFADGTLVALRVNTGSVAWIKSLKGASDRFVDVDATPIVLGETVYATSSSGGLFALDKTTGLVRWQVAIEGAGELTTDGLFVYVAAADQGVYAIDLAGYVVWRQGTHGGGEPAAPVLSGDYLLYALSDAGLFVADKRTGKVHQYFDPGFGISAPPTLVGDDMYVLSNSAVLYAMRLKRY